MDEREPKVAPGAVEDAYYAILAGGARYALFTSLIDLNLPPLLAGDGRTEDEILDVLKVEPHRGRKWLHALKLTGLIEPADKSAEPPRYRLSSMLREMFGADGWQGWFYREFLRYYRAAYALPTYGMLYGAQIDQAVRYPPTDHADILLLHEWMRNTALVTLEVIRRHVDFSNVEWMLDVGGGDGTMAFELHKAYPRLRIKVFNLPGPIALLRETTIKLEAVRNVFGVVGDFRTDKFPPGNDLVMFSRVLADWQPELCQELLKKAHAALQPEGRLIICEPLADQNPDLAIAWEHSYLPYDDFGLHCYKPLSLYIKMLSAAGFRVLKVHPRDENTIHCVIISERMEIES